MQQVGRRKDVMVLDVIARAYGVLFLVPITIAGERREERNTQVITTPSLSPHLRYFGAGGSW